MSYLLPLALVLFVRLPKIVGNDSGKVEFFHQCILDDPGSVCIWYLDCILTQKVLERVLVQGSSRAAI